MACMHTTANLPSSPYTFYKTNILLSYCMILQFKTQSVKKEILYRIYTRKLDEVSITN